MNVLAVEYTMSMSMRSDPCGPPRPFSQSGQACAARAKAVATQHCLGCGVKFGVLLWRHRCSECRGTFCCACSAPVGSAGSLLAAFQPHPQRACNLCAAAPRQLKEDAAAAVARLARKKPAVLLHLFLERLKRYEPGLVERIVGLVHAAPFDYAQARVRQTLDPHSGNPVWDVAISPDGLQLASAGYVL